ncbi:MAG: hypothetical protein IM598_12070 [Chitinophagaceae bacterium]|nr:hypothetical protein [Chitinophagaceae bacterium]MCA6459028.1 hypothetical protein [Chitinophagaceae bacterium]MCA6465558.1 hypothetical protein [Chitinophagaceae bacterium]
MNTAKYPNPEIGRSIHEMYPWTAICTFTTEYRLSMYSAEKLALRLYKTLASLSKMDLKMCWVAEPHADLFRYHLHCLIQSDLSYSELEAKIRSAWSKSSRFLGMRQQNRCDISEFDITKKGGYYIAKSLHQANVNWSLILPGME